MENNTLKNFISGLIGVVIALLIMLPSTIKLSKAHKEQTLKEFAEYKPDPTFIPFLLEYNQYVAQFYQASKTGEGSLKRVDVLILNKNTNDTYKFQVVLDGYDYKYLHENAAKFVESKVKNLPDKPINK